MKMHLLELTTLVGLVGLAACGDNVVVEPGGTSSSTSTGGGGATTTTTVSTSTTTTPPPTAEEACAATWDVQCTQYLGCFAVSSAAFLGDHATCLASMTADCVTDLLSPGNQVETSKKLACAQAVAPLTCEEFFLYISGETDLGGACADSPGSLAIGSGCGSGSQCASTVCDVPWEDVCGHCASGELGTSCDGLEGCKLGLRCHEGKCVSLGQLGDACGASAPCSVAFACLGGQCSPPLPAGSACDPSDFSSCKVGFLCNPVSNLCESFNVAPLGATCGVVNGKIRYCAKGSFCRYELGKPTVCTASIAEGESCDSVVSTYDPCDYPAVCVQGICRYPDASTCE